jgi:hypothetical protein|tara:strand:+ start:376 stop:492 length:117 start_codon:yes stop_codon:yes gene_type:complete
LKSTFIPFVAAFIVCGALFLGIDVAIMALQGLTLIFHP